MIHKELVLIFCIYYVFVYIKVKWSRYRPGVAQTVGTGIALLFHDRGTRRAEWSAAHRGCTLPRERHGTHFTEGWVGPRTGLDGRNISFQPGFDPGPSSHGLDAIPTEVTGPRVLIYYPHIKQRIIFQRSEYSSYLYKSPNKTSYKTQNGSNRNCCSLGDKDL